MIATIASGLLSNPASKLPKTLDRLLSGDLGYTRKQWPISDPPLLRREGLLHLLQFQWKWEGEDVDVPPLVQNVDG